MPERVKSVEVNNSSLIASLFTDADRIAFSHDALNAFAKKIARKIEDLGEFPKGVYEICVEAEIDFEGFTAQIEYSATKYSHAGDYFNPPLSEPENDIVRVIAVYENDGEGREFPEAAEYLEAMLN